MKVDLNQKPFRENHNAANVFDTRPGSQDRLVEDVEFWKLEHKKAMQKLADSKAEADSFLESFNEMEDLLRKEQSKNNAVDARMQLLAYEVEAAEREAKRWKCQFEQLLIENQAERQAREAIRVTDAAVQTWEFELEVDLCRRESNRHFLVLQDDIDFAANTVDAGQQTERVEMLSEKTIDEGKMDMFQYILVSNLKHKTVWQ